MNQLNNAFKILYSHNIIHRDIKLENILVNYNKNSKKDFIVKLGDFGLSRELILNNYIWMILFVVHQKHCFYQ